MTGKAVSRGRKPMPRATTRTGKKTASARATVQPDPKPATPKAPARKPAAPGRRRAAGRRPQVMHRLDTDTELARDAGLDATRKSIAPLRTEDDEDLDWLTEEDDPRKQIVEDDEEWNAHHDEW